MEVVLFMFIKSIRTADFELQGLRVLSASGDRTLTLRQRNKKGLEDYFCEKL